jgi:hypothetical protein
MITVTGNTYPHRAVLGNMGGRWNAVARGWDFEDAEVARQAQEIVGSSVASPRGRGRRQSYYTRFSSGAEVFVNKRGRCEDAPCCGCCS